MSRFHLYVMRTADPWSENSCVQVLLTRQEFAGALDLISTSQDIIKVVHDLLGRVANSGPDPVWSVRFSFLKGKRKNPYPWKDLEEAVLIAFYYIKLKKQLMLVIFSNV